MFWVTASCSRRMFRLCGVQSYTFLKDNWFWLTWISQWSGKRNASVIRESGNLANGREWSRIGLLLSQWAWVPRTLLQCRAIIYRVNIEYQNLWSPLHQKQESCNTARCLETDFYISKIYALIFYMYFNVKNFSDAVHRLTV